MFKETDFTKKMYRPGEVADILGVSYMTIRKYDMTGKLPMSKTEKGRRVIDRAALLDYLDSLGVLLRDKIEKRDVIYARVSSHDQKRHGDLDRQATFLIEHVHDLKNPMILKEVGSGLNDKRPKLLQLIQMVMNGEVDRVFVTYRDRLTRFGFNYLATIFEAKDVKIVVVKDEKNEKTVEQELTEDMMSLLASFSGKLYGMRSRKKMQDYINTHKNMNKVDLREILKEGEGHEWDDGTYCHDEARSSRST